MKRLMEGDFRQIVDLKDLIPSLRSCKIMEATKTIQEKGKAVGNSRKNKKLYKMKYNYGCAINNICIVTTI